MIKSSFVFFGDFGSLVDIPPGTSISGTPLSRSTPRSVSPFFYASISKFISFFQKHQNQCIVHIYRRYVMYVIYVMSSQVLDNLSHDEALSLLKKVACFFTVVIVIIRRTTFSTFFLHKCFKFKLVC